MLAAREEYKLEKDDISNGFRPGRLLGAQRIIELSAPRTRYGNCYPILRSILKDQQGEMEQLSFLLSTQGLTTEQIGEVFEQLYAHHYSKESLSRLAQRAHQEVLDWPECPLNPYYPIVYIDCIFVPLHRGSTVSREAIYALLAVKADQKREVLGILCHPSESSQGWSDVFGKLKARFGMDDSCAKDLLAIAFIASSRLLKASGEMLSSCHGTNEAHLYHEGALALAAWLGDLQASELLSTQTSGLLHDLEA